MNVKVVLLTTAYLVITACSQQTTEVPSGIKPFGTLQELMLSVIDPNVDPIWNSVSTTVTKEGVEEKAPSSDEEWAVLRKHAIALIEAGNLLQIPDRQVAVKGASTSIHPVEEDPKKIEALIRHNRADFDLKAQGLQEATKIALIAIDEKNPDALLKAGEGIEKACEACHSAYWYPNDKLPVSFKPLGQAESGLFARLIKQVDLS
jgi:hypothetical protein